MKPNETKLLILDKIPMMDPGAPTPLILSSEYRFALGYYLFTSQDNINENNIILIKFDHILIYKFGVPNENSINKHPLYNLGIEQYRIHEVINSSWLEDVYKFTPNRGYKHFLISFHDSTLEIIAEEYQFKQYTKNKIEDLIPEMLEIINS